MTDDLSFFPPYFGEGILAYFPTQTSLPNPNRKRSLMINWYIPSIWMISISRLGIIFNSIESLWSKVLHWNHAKWVGKWHHPKGLGCVICFHGKLDFKWLLSDWPYKQELLLFHNVDVCLIQRKPNWVFLTFEDMKMLK